MLHPRRTGCPRPGAAGGSEGRSRAVPRHRESLAASRRRPPPPPRCAANHRAASYPLPAAWHDLPTPKTAIQMIPRSAGRQLPRSCWYAATALPRFLPTTKQGKSAPNQFEAAGLFPSRDEGLGRGVRGEGGMSRTNANSSKWVLACHIKLAGSKSAWQARLLSCARPADRLVCSEA